jgi:hypothetical protein
MKTLFFINISLESKKKMFWFEEINNDQLKNNQRENFHFCFKFDRDTKEKHKKY